MFSPSQGSVLCDYSCLSSLPLNLCTIVYYRRPCSSTRSLSACSSSVSLSACTKHGSLCTYTCQQHQPLSHSYMYMKVVATTGYVPVPVSVVVLQLPLVNRMKNELSSISRASVQLSRLHLQGRKRQREGIICKH